MDKTRLVIFDLDGTLVNAYPAINQSFNYTMRRLEYPIQPAAVIRRAVGRGDKNLLRPFIKKRDLSRALSIYRRHHRLSLADKSRLFPAALDLLRGLKTRGYYLAVASNRPTAFSRLLIRHLGVERYFDYVLCADRAEDLKPKPVILKRIMRHFKVKPGQAIYVGDMTVDVHTGRNAGVKTIIITTGSSTREEVRRQGPWRILDNLRQVRRVIRGAA